MAAPRTVRSRSVLYVVVLSAVTLLAAQQVIQPFRSRVSENVSRLDRVGARAASPINKAIKKRFSYDELKKENDALRAENDKLRAANLRYDEALAENKELLALNKLTDPNGYKSVRARIIGGPLNNTEQTIRIDRGTVQGVKKDNTVTSESGLIGRVVGVTKNTATVMLVTDPKMAVGVRFSRSGETGLARGQNIGEPLRIEIVALNASVARGDVVVTSGLNDSRFPAGLPLGRVDSVRPGSISKEVTVRPGVDLRRIRFVRVLTQTS